MRLLCNDVNFINVLLILSKDDSQKKHIYLLFILTCLIKTCFECVLQTVSAFIEALDYLLYLWSSFGLIVRDFFFLFMLICFNQVRIVTAGSLYFEFLLKLLTDFLSSMNTASSFWNLSLFKFLVGCCQSRFYHLTLSKLLLVSL